MMDFYEEVYMEIVSFYILFILRFSGVLSEVNVFQKHLNFMVSCEF